MYALQIRILSVLCFVFVYFASTGTRECFFGPANHFEQVFVYFYYFVAPANNHTPVSGVSQYGGGIDWDCTQG